MGDEQIVYVTSPGERAIAAAPVQPSVLFGAEGTNRPGSAAVAQLKPYVPARTGALLRRCAKSRPSIMPSSKCPTKLPIATGRIGAISSATKGFIPRSIGISTGPPSTHQSTPHIAPQPSAVAVECTLLPTSRPKNAPITALLKR